MWKALLALLLKPETLLAILKDFWKVIALIVRWYIQREIEKAARKAEDKKREDDHGKVPGQVDPPGNGLGDGRSTVDDMLGGGGKKP